MALILLDRVKVNTTTTGTGTVVLANTAPTGYQTFAVIGNANTTYYTIAGQTSAEWEVGIGTYYLANSSLSRDTILSSSAANAAVTFGVGTKDVFVTYPASQSVNEDAANIVTITSLVSSNVLISGGQVNSVAHTGGSINNMTIGATTANTISGTTLGLTNVFTSTYAGSATSGATQIYLNGATSNRIDYATTGVGAPAVTSRSTGTKIVLYPFVSASATDYAIGIENNAIWGSVPSATQSFKWYANVTAVATLLGTGVLSTTGGFSGNGANLTALSATAITTGAINSIPVGNATPSTGAFTNLSATTINSTSTTLLATSSGNLTVGGTTSTAKFEVQAGVLGNVANNTVEISRFNYTATNAEYVRLYGLRNSNGADWTTTTTRLQQRVDVTDQGYIDFNPPSGNYGLAFGSGSTEYMRIANGGNVSVDTSVLFVDATNNRVGVGTASPGVALDVQAASNATLTARIYNTNTNSATVTALQLNAGGKYTNLSVNYTGNYFLNQGSGGIVAYYEDYDTHYFRNNAGKEQLVVSSTASANNYAQITGGLGVGPTLSAIGADTNIDLKLTPKGTGYANITSGGVKLGNSTIQDSAGNLVFTTGGANVTAFTLDQNKLSTFAASIKETANVSTANATANVTLNAITQSVLYYTGNATANTTINITGNSTVTLNNAMANGQSISVVFMNTQGNTAYYVSTYQIDGVGVTPKWQGNAAPTSGNARGIDTYCFTAIKTGSATYTVLASQTQFA